MTRIASLAASTVLTGLGFSQAQAQASPAQIAQLYAGVPVAEGRAAGAAVAILQPGQAPQFFSFGYADVARRVPFTPATLTEIGSVTKVFTTNLFGQAVAAGTLSTGQTLGQFSTALGTLPATTAAATLGEVANFTAGFPSLAPDCTTGSKTGCLHSSRPDIRSYDAAQFAAYFRHYPVPSMPPAEYFYSDFSIGLLGLLLGDPGVQPLSNAALSHYAKRLRTDVLEPLGMTSTWFDVPAASRGLMAGGYQLPMLDSTVANGAVTGIVCTSFAGPYRHAPKVRISGGGGTGAAAVAELTNGFISGISVTSGGSNYVPPPKVVFEAPPAGQIAASGHAVVVDGVVQGISVDAVGAGYAPGATIGVTITGGRTADGRDATGFATLADGHVVAASVTDGGAGYVPPLTISAEPGERIRSTIPIWAPAGALKSSLADMALFAQAAMAAAQGSGSGLVAQGFRVAQTPSVCAGKTMTAPPNCPYGMAQGGMAWVLTPADSVSGFPATLSKDGGLNGYTTEVLTMPAAGLGVVVVFNSGQDGANSEKGDQFVGANAYVTARNVLGALWMESQTR